MNVDMALLIIRVVAGTTLAAHGAQKLFGWFGGHGIDGTGAFLQSMGFPRVHAWLAALTEFGGGLAHALGLLTPLAGAAVAGVMLVAIAVAHWKNGFFSMSGGFEFPLVLATAGIAIAFSGPGAWSLDHLFGWSLGGTEWGVAAIGLAVISSAAIVGMRSVRMERGSGREVPA
ncbi:MAG: putative oxidoreductase [Actinomycetota bacterium]|jgi:putative oxidoreductase